MSKLDTINRVLPTVVVCYLADLKGSCERLKFFFFYALLQAQHDVIPKAIGGNKF